MIGFLGLSHLGFVSAAAAANKGFDVVGFDEDAALVEHLRTGHLPVAEPGLAEILAETTDRLQLTSDPTAIGRCSLVYVAVDVPTACDDASDPEPVHRFLELAAAHSAPGTSLVVLSQVEPGFTRARRSFVEQESRTLHYQVETLIFGRAVDRALRPERFIVGCSDPSRPLPRALTEHLAAYDCPILPMRYESAEVCKIAINAFLVSSISTTNMLAELCEQIGADWEEIAPALRLDRRIGQHAYLAPGLGVGGSNLTRDLATIERLASVNGSDASVIDVWRAHARYRAGWPLLVLHERVLSRVAEPRIGIWGLSYKESTESTRNSPGLRLAQTLARAGIEIAAYDPEAEPVTVDSPTFRRVDDPLQACAEVDALVVTTPWDEFRGIDLTQVAEAMRGSLLIDPYGILEDHPGLERVRLGAPC